jgi:hypothetical protein
MISYPVYKLIHLIGIFMILMSFAALIMLQLSKSPAIQISKKWIFMNHGIGLFLAILGGFGLLARLQIFWPWPTWIVIKTGLWILAAVLAPLIIRTPAFARLWWFLVIGLGSAAVIAVNFRPV